MLFRSVAEVSETCTRAIGDVASILLMIGGSGAFKEVLVQTGVDRTIAAALSSLPLDPLLLDPPPLPTAPPIAVHGLLPPTRLRRPLRRDPE